MSVEPPRSLLHTFAIDGQIATCVPLVQGHTHDTFIVTWDTSEGPTRYVHQRMNRNLFSDFGLLMTNIVTVSSHIRRKVEEEGTSDCALTVIPTADGSYLVEDGEGRFWRTFRFVEGTSTYDDCPSAAVAEEAGAKSGRFIRYLRDLDCKEIGETVPFFHHTPKRFERLDDAVSTDTYNRAKNCHRELELVGSKRELGETVVGAIERGEIPIRVTHNDTKINNFLFSKDTGQAICLVDLDTCMPSTPLYDYGDMVRSVCAIAPEDNWEAMDLNRDFLAALTRGFLREVGDELTPDELNLLPKAPAVISLTLGVRFLTDYLIGDRDFAPKRADHNLDRARAQLRLMERLVEAQQVINADESLVNLRS